MTTPRTPRAGSIEPLESRIVLSAGDFDLTFGNGTGNLTTDFVTYSLLESFHAVAIQTDGKILAVGSATDGYTRFSPDIALVRFNPDGTPDLSFGTGGQALFNFGATDESHDEAYAVVIQPDGKIVVGGRAWHLNNPPGYDPATSPALPAATPDYDFALARFNADGSVDTSFGTSGYVVTDLGSKTDVIHGLALQSDHSIVAVGTEGNSIALARYTSAGLLDPTFGTGGTTINYFGGSDSGNAVALQNTDGRIVIAGTTGKDFLLARYNTDGTLDNTFGTGGKTFLDFGTASDIANALIIDGTGRILVGGSYQATPTAAHFALVRLTTAGVPDATFGAGGQVMLDVDGALQGTDQISAIAVQADSNIVVAGSAPVTGINGVTNYVAVRFSDTGVLDTGYGVGGRAFADFGASSYDTAGGAALDANGKLVVAGSSRDYSIPLDSGHVSVARFDGAGVLDPTFSNDGLVQFDVKRPGDNPARGFAFDGSKIVVAGITSSTSSLGGSHAALVRYLADGSLDPTFGDGGRVFADVNLYADEPFAVVIQPDHKIIVAGSYFQNNGAGAPAAYGLIERFNADGTLDATFGDHGLVLPTNIYLGGIAQEATIDSIALQPDGKIVTLEHAANRFAGFSKAVVDRYNADGTLDANFATGGRAVYDASQGVPFQALLLQTDGRFLLGGTGAQGQIELSRLTAAGVLDPTFGNGGIVVQDFPNSDETFAGMVFEPNGEISVGASAALTTVASNGATGYAEIIRFAGDGTLDASFALGGRSAGAAYAGKFTVDGFVRESDGRYLFAIGSGNGSAGERIVRTTLTGDFDDTWGQGGSVTINGFGHSIAELPDGKILAVGTSGFLGGATDRDFAITKLLTAPESSPNGVFRFAFASGLADESAAFATITVLRTGGSAGAATVHYATAGGTASPTADYMPVSGDLLFADGVTSLSFQVPLDNNPNGEPDLTVNLILSNPTGGAVLDNPKTAVMHIAAHTGPFGSVDPDFGDNGIGFSDHTQSVSGRNDLEQVADMAFQADGKIVVVGYTDSFSLLGDFNFLVSRFNADGTPDTSFSGDGSIMTDFKTDPDTGGAVAVLSDGKILVAGTVNVPDGGVRHYPDGFNTLGDTEHIGFARYDPDGTLDRTFGDNGEIIFTMPGGVEPDTRFGDMQLLPNGQFVVGVVSSAHDTSNNTSILSSGILRFNPDGTLDTTFGVNGYAKTAPLLLNGSSYAAPGVGAVAVQPDGKILFTASIDADIHGDQHLGVIRFNPNGTLDTTFGTGGTETVDGLVGIGTEQARAMLVQADGKIVIAGHAGSNGSVIRLNANGTLDVGFHGTGVYLSNIFADFYDLGQLSNGQLVAVGADGTPGVGSGSNSQRDVLQLLTDGTPDPLFGIQGIAVIGQLAKGGVHDGALLVQPDNSIIAGFGGQLKTDLGLNSQFTLARITTNPGAGVFQLDGTSLHVDEKAGIAHIFIERSGGTEGAVTLHYQTADGTAHAGSHYTAVSGTVTFQDGDRQMEIDVPIRQDGIPNDTQNFTFTISAPSGTATLGAISTATVTIDDGPGTLGFLSPAFNFIEGNNLVNIQVVRTLGSNGGVTVDYTIQPGTAQSGVDYDAIPSGTLTFGDGQTVATITLALKSNPLNGGEESFGITLSNPLGAQLGLSTSTVNIFELQAGAGNNAGGLDGDFGTNGVTRVNPFSTSTVASYATAVQADGKIIVVGETGGALSDFAIVRYKADGTLDPTFGTSGFVTTDFFGHGDSARSVVIQPDGKIVVAGWALRDGRGDFAIARYNLNGTLDTTFDGDGKATVDFGGLDDRASSVALAPNGKIVVAGWTENPLLFDIAVARMNADGSLDKTFSSDGKVTTDFSGRVDSANAVIVQPDGKVIAGGVSTLAASGAVGGARDLAIVRYNLDGSLDKTFSNDGMILGTESGTNSQTALNALVLRSDGSLIGVGDQFGDIRVSTFTAAGVLKGFLDINITSVNSLNSNETPSAAALEPDGSLVIVGTTTFPSEFLQRLAIVKLDPNLKPDINFGLKSKIALQGFNGARAVALDADGNIVTVGGAFEVARFLNESKAPLQGAFQLNQFSYTIDESAGKIAITVSRPHDKNFGRVTVDYATIGLDALPGQDFTSVTGTLVFEETETTKTFSIPIINDNLAEGVESFAVILANPTGGAELSSLSYATVTIPANDKGGANGANGGFSFGSNYSSSGSEQYGLAFVDIQRTGGSVGAISVDYGTVDGTAKAGLDYTAQFGTLNFADGQTEQFIVIPVTQDTEVEGTENFFVKFSSPTGGATLGSGTFNTITIGVTDFVPSVTCTNASALDTTFGTNGVVSTDLGQAGAQDAYSILQQTDGKIIAIGAAGYVFNSPNAGDGLGLVRYNPDGSLDPTFGTGGKTVTNVSQGPGFEGAFGAEILKDGKILVVGLSYGDGQENIVLARYSAKGVLDKTFGTKGIALQPILNGYTTLFFQQGNGSVAFEPDGKPVIGATSPDGIDSSLALYRFNLNGTLDSTFGVGGTVTYDSNAGSDAVSSLAVQPDGKLIVTDGGVLRFNLDGTLDKAFGKDGLVETNLGDIFYPNTPNLIHLNQSFLGASLVQPADGKIVVFGFGATSIRDPLQTSPSDFKSGLLAIRYNSDGTLDPTFGNQGVSIVSSQPGVSFPSTIHSAAMDSDGRYVIAGVGFGAGRILPDGRADLSFGTNGAAYFPGVFGNAQDVLVQPDGHIVLAGGNGFSDGNFTLVRLVGGDASGAVRINNTNFRISEDGGSLIVPFERLCGWDGPVSITVTTSDGTAIAGVDYTGINQTLSWGNREAGVKTIQIPIIDDQLAQGNLTFHVNFGTATGGVMLSGQTNADATIIDDEAPGKIEFSAARFDATENAGTAMITVHRVDGKGGGVDVNYTVDTGGTAVANQDYVPTSGTLHFASGQTTASFPITLLDNQTLNEDKTIVFTLSDPTNGASLGDSVQTRLTIIDNEVPQGGVFEFGVAKAEISEGGGGVLVTVTRTDGFAGEATVQFDATGGTAVAGHDYISVSRVFDFLPGETVKTIFLPVFNNSIVDGDRTLVLSLSHPTGDHIMTTDTTPTIGEIGTETITIHDDDARALAIFPGNFQVLGTTVKVSEHAASAPIVILRQGGLDGPASVDVTLMDGTAKAGRDYDGTTIHVTFADGELSKTVNVPIRNDFLGESNETFTATLANPGNGASLGIQLSTVVTIVDDDVASLQDFNNDTNRDLVVIAKGKVELLAGNGNGSFAAPMAITTLKGPSAFFSADFNNDGKNDLIVFSASHKSIVFVAGNGDGTFKAPIAFSSAKATKSLVFGDFNNDGIPDLAAMQKKGVNVFLNKGDGTFNAPLTYSAGKSLGTMVVGDFNGDGNLDLAVSNGGKHPTVSLLAGDGKGVFATPTVSLLPKGVKSIVAGDFSGDGHLDLAAVLPKSKVGIIPGDGRGFFGVVSPYPDVKSPSLLGLGDFDDDLKLDLLTINAKKIAGIIANNGGFTFAAATSLKTAFSPKFIAICDINHDDDPDLVMWDKSGKYKVALGAAGTTFQVI